MQPTFLPQQHRRHRSLSSSNCERDDDLMLFHELQKKESAAFSVQRAPPLTPPGGEDIFSSSECDQHDYDWLMVPPATPLIPTLDHPELVGNGGLASNASPSMQSPTSEAILKLGSSRSEPPSRVQPSVRVCKSVDTSVALTSLSSSTLRKSSPSSSSLSTATHPLSMPARSSTPVSRLIARPPTPTRSASGAGIHSSTPTGRSTTPSNRAVSSSTRPSTPIKRPATPTRVNNSSSSSGKTSSSSNKQSALASQSASSSRPSSPAARARQLTVHPAVVVGTLQEQPSNLRADRPRSNPRGSVALKSSSTTAAVKPTHSEPTDGAARTKRPSSSPIVTRGRLSSESPNGHKSLMQKTGLLHDAGKVLLSSGAGSKMVDRLMPPRKPLSVSQERAPLSAINPQPAKALKPTPPHDVKSMTKARESTGFGRNVSKKSLDMALRHMDIQGSNTSSFQSFMSNVPTASLYSVRSRNGRGNSSSSIASSPMATSSNASSEYGMSLVIDPESSDYFDETSSDMGSRASTISHSDSTMAFSNERKVSHWLGSPGYLGDGSADIMAIFEQGLASLSSPESPLISQQEGVLDCDEFVLESL